MDMSGYGIAARKYLEILDPIIQKRNINFKIYSCLGAVLDESAFTAKEKELINKYSFNDNKEIEDFIQNSDYECVWHMPTPMALMADKRFKTTKNIETPVLMNIISSSKRNHHLVVWETTDISKEWKETIDWFKPDSIITACEMNVDMFSRYCDDVLLAPHPVFNIEDAGISPMNLPYDLNNKFVIFSMSQWTHRKGFDKLLKAFTAELGDQEDCVLILKTFPSGEARTPQDIANMVNGIRNGVLKENRKNNVVLIPDYVHESNINWLYKNSDIFALLPRGEGFGLTVFESILNGLPVLVPAEGGHLDYISKDSKFMVDGMWDTCVTTDVAYPIDSEWFESNISSARKKMRLAYEMWKSDNLKQEGEKLKKHLLSSENFKPNKIAGDIIDFVTREQLNTQSDKELKRAKLRRKISTTSDLQTQVDILKDSYKGDTAYILNCGPSLNEYSEDFLKDFLSDKLTLSVKQAYNKFPTVSDFHFFNCANLPMPICEPILQHYKYDEKNRPIIIASSNYDLHKRWSNCQKQDLFFKIPIRTEINNEFVTITKKFDDYLLSNSLTRPCGPGIMLETVIFMAVHLGVKKIVGIGWDLTMDKVNEDTYQHFYGNTQNLFNRGDILDWEIEAGRTSSEDVCYWLKDLGIELQLASSTSTLYEGIERIKLN